MVTRFSTYKCALFAMVVISIWFLIGMHFIYTNNVYSRQTFLGSEFQNLSRSILTIDQCILCWKAIFESNIINKQIQMQSPNKYSEHILYIDDINNMSLLSLLSTTNDILRQLQQNGKDQSIEYRQHLFLRRLIGVISHRNNLQTHKIYKNLLITFNSFNFDAYNQKKKFLNIHISKAGGSSICSTFNNLPFDGIRTPDKSVCNYRYKMQSMTCDEEWISSKDYDMIARENAMNVFYDNETNEYFPKLCNNFIYLLPFRNPLERAFSFIQSVNRLELSANHQIYRRVNESDNELETENCIKAFITTNGMKFQRITNGDGFKGIFVDLLNAKTENETLISSESDFSAFCQQFQHKSDSLQVVEDECYKKGVSYKWIYELFGDDFMIRRRGDLFCGLRLMQSSVSNTFTSWLGYGDKNKWILSAQLNPRSVIQSKHFLNALWVLLSIDYVLPFWRFYKSDVIESEGNDFEFGMKSKIWNVSLNAILEHFERNGFKKKNDESFHGWSYVGHNEGRSNHIKAKNVAKSMTKKDIEMLRKYNQFDIELFKMAQWISIIDAEYFGLGVNDA